MTPNGQVMTQYPQPLQMSGCTYTPPNSVRMIDPVGHASRHPATSQCLQTSEENSHAVASGAFPPRPTCGAPSTNFTCRHVECPRARVLSYDLPLKWKPSSGTPFHSLHATSQALQPMQRVESVKKPVTVTAGRRARIVPGVSADLTYCRCRTCHDARRLAVEGNSLAI